MSAYALRASNLAISRDHWKALKATAELDGLKTAEEVAAKLIAAHLASRPDVQAYMADEAAALKAVRAKHKIERNEG